LQQEKEANSILIKGKLTGIKYLAGVDMSHAQGSSLLYATVVVMRAHNLEIVEVAHASKEASFPYVPGYLSYREGPVLVAAIKKLKTVVDLWFFDGQGLAHPRHFGLACHMGLLLNKPAIGVAKKLFVGEHDPVGIRAGNRKPLKFENQIVGEVLRTKSKTAPVYVSPGHKLSVKEAGNWAFKVSKGWRIPEPTRQAHIHVNRFRRECEKR
jgi:deoxyribonuclease V